MPHPFNPLPLPRAPVPLVGTPRVLTTTLLAVVACPCQGADPLTLLAMMVDGRIGAVPVVCPACGQALHVAGVSPTAAGWTVVIDRRPT